MAADINDKFNQATTTGRPSPATLTALKSIGASSITVNATTEWPTDTAVHFTMYEVDANNDKVDGTQTDWKGIVNSSTTITELVLQAGTDQEYAIGSKVICAPTAAWADEVVEGIAVHAAQDGTLLESAVRTALNLGSESTSGWEVLGETIDSVTSNGNRSYTVTYNTTDLTDTLSPGMRFRTTRGTAAPDECADLESGSTQYFSKSSPTGITFTDDYTCMAWVKPESLTGAAQVVVGRHDGSTGFFLAIDGGGQVRIFSDAGANTYNERSYQGVPVDKWVHIAGTMNASGGDAKVYINGALALSENIASTATAAAVQAGDLQIGVFNSASNHFDGKIAQVGVFDAVLSEATIQEYMTRPLTGSETNCVGAWSLDNDITDLTSNNNDLTASGGAVATDNDSPFGNGGVSTTLDYGIITKVAYSTNTDVTVQLPEGCTIDATNAISASSYSTNDTPYGFPRDAYWNILCPLGAQLDVTSDSFASSGLEINLPVGAWDLSFHTFLRITVSSNVNRYLEIAISTSTSSISDKLMATGLGGTDNVSGDVSYDQGGLANRVNNEAMTVYYLIVRNVATSTTSSIYGMDSNVPTIYEAKFAYL